MKLIAQQDFKWAHRGVEVEEFTEGQEIETDDEDLIEVSTTEGWAVPADGSVQRAEGDAVDVSASEVDVAVAPSKPGRKPKVQ